MRIGDGSNTIHMTKAQQAWEARRAAQKNAGTPHQAAEVQQTAPPSPRAVPEAPKAADIPAPSLPHWEQTVREVQHIAHQAGYVGVNEQDIRRAYQYGESLLADYHV